MDGDALAIGERPGNARNRFREPGKLRWRVEMIDRGSQEARRRIGIGETPPAQQMGDDWLESQGARQPVDRGLIDFGVLPEGRYHAQYAASAAKSRPRRPISRNFL